MNIRSLFGSRTLITALLVSVTFLFALVVGYLNPVQIMELKTRDMLMNLRGADSLDHSDIIIVEISQEADEEIPYLWPWPRYVYAKLIENLNRAGVRAIGIDVVFNDPDWSEPSNDSLLAEALSTHGNVVNVGHIRERVERVANGSETVQTSTVFPHRLLRQANRNPVGLVEMVHDRDDFIRSYLLHREVLNQKHYSLAIEMIRLLDGIGEEEFGRGDGVLRLGDHSIPLFAGNSMLINYYGGAGSFETIGFERIIDDEEFETVTEMEAFPTNYFDDPEYGLLHQGVLEDKIVLVGATMPELQDFHPVPVHSGGRSTMAGVEIHAHVLQAILDGRHLSVVEGSIHLMILLLISIIVVWATRSLTFWPALGVTIALLAGWITLSAWLFFEYQLILFYISPALAIIAGYGGVTARQYVREMREKQRVKSMFSSYVSPKLVEKMVESQDEIGLGGEEMELTALFSDIANFSTLSEQLSPSKLIELMNEYLEEMTAIVMNRGGTLDKYIGDAVMAFYGAPIPQADHAQKACISAIEMQKALTTLRNRWEERDPDLPDDILNLRIRIGINTGEMVVGNMGSSLRFNYTILGDHVNVAARCESASKKYGVETMITEDTLQQADPSGDLFLVRFLDNIRVKGRRKPVRIFELIGYREGADEDQLRGIRIFDEATELFYRQRWSEAEDLFRQADEMEEQITGRPRAHITPSELYLQRCEYLHAHPPGEEWDGVFEQTAKI